jgi:hypothetical protein
MEIRTQSGQVMYESEFRTHMKETTGASWNQTTDEVLQSLGATVVFEGPQASGGTVYQYSMRQGVEQIEGKWYTKYVLGPIFTATPATDTEPAKTAAQNEAAYKAIKDAEQAKSVRQTRDQKLAETDWRFRSDMTPSQEWKDYCQALRDLPAQSGFPWTVVYPTQPEA